MAIGFGEGRELILKIGSVLERGIHDVEFRSSRVRGLPDELERLFGGETPDHGEILAVITISAAVGTAPHRLHMDRGILEYGQGPCQVGVRHRGKIEELGFLVYLRERPMLRNIA
jgi:hypothetical protein